MARYKGTQASHLYEKSMHTLCTISEQPLLAEASTILDRSLSHTYAHSAIMVCMYYVADPPGQTEALNVRVELHVPWQLLSVHVWPHLVISRPD